MKKNQSGVSLIALVITIIVVIILAAVAFGSSTDTITNANFSTFTNNLGEVRTAFQTVATTVKGEEAKNQITRTDAQVFNFVAKGGTLLSEDAQQDAWLPRALANALDCTELDKDAMEDVLDMKLPVIKVNTDLGTGREVAYFITNKGTIFVWPPYEYENELYVTDTIKLEGVKADAASAVYTDDDTASYTFTVDGVEITVKNADQLSVEQPSVTNANVDNVDTLATIFYTDAANAASPVGIESDLLFSASGDKIQTER